MPWEAALSIVCLDTVAVQRNWMGLVIRETENADPISMLLFNRRKKDDGLASVPESSLWLWWP